MEILSNPIVQILASTWYCNNVVKRVPKGLPRLVCLFPIFFIFSTIPWFFSSSVALRAISAFFLTWLSSFKLLSFAFHRGPLAASSILSTVDFGALAVFPLRIKQDRTKNILKRYEIVRFLDQPYMATSLREFWGRRWNKMSSYVLRVTVYDPTREFLKGSGVVGPETARVGAMVATLAVSGVMHEVVFYYITCGMRPTWEVTWFFVLHGICMVVEGWAGFLARNKGWKPIRPVVAQVLTVGFVLVTFYWLIVLPIWIRGGGDCNNSAIYM